MLLAANVAFDCLPETCPRRNWICSSSPPASWQNRAQERRRSCGAIGGIFILAAVFLTTCQTVFSEMPCPQSLPARQTHRNSGPLSIPAAINQESRVSFTQFGTGTVRMCLPLPNKIHDGPALLATLQTLQHQFRKLAAA